MKAATGKQIVRFLNSLTLLKLIPFDAQTPQQKDMALEGYRLMMKTIAKEAAKITEEMKDEV